MYFPVYRAGYKSQSPPFTIFQDMLRSFPDKESPDPGSDSLQYLIQTNETR